MCPVSARSSSIQTPGNEPGDGYGPENNTSDKRSREIVAQARSWLGTPWRHQGRLKGVACDCAGLIVGIGQELGYTDYDFRAYGHMPDGTTLRRICNTHLDRASELGLGHVLLMRFKKHPQHLAIVGDKGSPFSIIHAYAEARKCVEHRLDDVWMGRICGIYRFKGTG